MPVYVTKIVENVDKIDTYLCRNRTCGKMVENAEHLKLFKVCNRIQMQSH